MKPHKLTDSMIQDYGKNLFEEEKSKATIDKYLRDIRSFYESLPDDKIVDKNRVIHYKMQLTGTYKATSVNSMLTAVNGIFSYLGWTECKVKLLKIQKSSFRNSQQDMSRDDYIKLVETANQQGKVRLGMIIQTICAAGIRVSELKYMTVEAVKSSRAVINKKGKTRIILIPPELQSALLTYCEEQEICSGMIFSTRSGKPLDRSNIWREMKNLGKSATVMDEKVFPHNLRHLFAVTYYKKEKNVVYLSDVLGHSSVETTRIYTSVDEAEHYKHLTGLGLVL